MPTTEQRQNSNAFPAFGAAHGSGSRLQYRTILADPPWRQRMTGRWQGKHKRPEKLPYPTLSVEDICALPIGELAAEGAHLWLWTTNEYLEAGFAVMRAWGFRYLAPITWLKPSGCGAWFIHRTQTMLFGYRQPLNMRERFKPTLIQAPEQSHSAKPPESYELIEAVSEPMRVELFARPWTPLFPRRHGWDVWGNEVPQDVALVTPNEQSSPTPGQKRHEFDSTAIPAFGAAQC
jgi:N6-adenosine-specific RNA methylase IME4